MKIITRRGFTARAQADVRRSASRAGEQGESSGEVLTPFRKCYSVRGRREGSATSAVSPRASTETSVIAKQSTKEMERNRKKNTLRKAEREEK